VTLTYDIIQENSICTIKTQKPIRGPVTAGYKIYSQCFAWVGKIDAYIWQSLGQTGIKYVI